MPGTLILIPTVGELNVLKPRLSGLTDVDIQLVGFGPVASAARTSFLIAAKQPERIVLAGIAGAFTRELAPGHATIFEHVAMYGIGAGTGDAFRNAGELGWAHWTETVADQAPIRIGDAISLCQSEDDSLPAPQLLTVCAAAATQKDVRDRIARFPNAIAEDMEGFSVAIAAAMAGVPLMIVRGISNIAGDRDKSRWRIVDALNAAADVVLEKLK
ncbi:MAG: futalosine hydrolase [Fuerstiella sp.]